MGIPFLLAKKIGANAVPQSIVASQPALQCVKILMTLTTPNCPVAETLPKEVEEKVKSLDAVKDAKVEITFDPPWSQDLMSEEAKLELGLL